MCALIEVGLPKELLTNFKKFTDPTVISNSKISAIPTGKSSTIGLLGSVKIVPIIPGDPTNSAQPNFQPCCVIL